MSKPVIRRASRKDGALHRIVITIRPSDLDIARNFGHGNISAGIRHALEIVALATSAASPKILTQ